MPLKDVSDQQNTGKFKVAFPQSGSLNAKQENVRKHIFLMILVNVFGESKPIFC